VNALITRTQWTQTPDAYYPYQQNYAGYGHCKSAKLTAYKVRYENAKLNICIETTAENEHSVECRRKMFSH